MEIQAFDVTTRSWLEKVVGHSVPLPSLDGKLRTDEEALSAAADCFGHVVFGKPIAVLEPGSVEDIVRMVCFAREQGIRIGPRGNGHGALGQSLVEGGIVVQMSGLHFPPAFGDDWVEVSGGMSWHDVLKVSLQRGLRPPLQPSIPSLTVGGMLSVVGMTGQSFRYGGFVDHVLRMEVVTGEGRLVGCSPTENPDLFNAALGGLGQCGIIVKARLHLIPADTHIRRVRLYYPDLDSMFDDQRLLVSDSRFQRFNGHIIASPIGGWIYYIDGIRTFTPPEEPVVAQLIQGLSHVPGSERVRDYGLFEHATANVFEMFLRETGRYTDQPHVFVPVCIPDSTMKGFAEWLFSLLKPSDYGMDMPVEVYPIWREYFTRPLVRLPNEPLFWSWTYFQQIAPELHAQGRDLERTQLIYQRALECGGTLNPGGILPKDRQAWQEHFGSAWDEFAGAKRKFDPDKILSPGPGIF